MNGALGTFTVQAVQRRQTGELTGANAREALRFIVNATQTKKVFLKRKYIQSLQFQLTQQLSENKDYPSLRLLEALREPILGNSLHVMGWTLKHRIFVLMFLCRSCQPAKLLGAIGRIATNAVLLSRHSGGFGNEKCLLKTSREARRTGWLLCDSGLDTYGSIFPA